MRERLTKLLRYKLPLILLIAIVARVAFLLLFPDIFAYDTEDSIHGSIAYDAYALNLLETGIYGQETSIADARIPPMYSYVLAGVYAIFGRGYWQLGLFHTLLDVLSIALLYDISRRLFTGEIRLSETLTVKRGELIGALAGVFMAVYPYLIFQNLTLIDTPFFILQLHTYLWLMVVLREREALDKWTWLIAILGGVVLGIMTLTRPITPPLVLLVALWFLFRLNLKQTIVRQLPVAICSVLVVMPWIVRNFEVFDAFVPMTTTSGANLWQGNSEWTIPVFRAGYDVQWTAPDVNAPKDSREADAERFALALDFWRENPDKIPELLFTKFIVHWSIDIAPRFNPQANEQFALDNNGELVIVQAEESIAGVTDANTSYDSGLLDTVGRPVHRYYFGSLLLLAIVGVWLSRREWREVSLLWFVQISMTLIYLIFHPATRYRVPSDPLLFILSAYSLIYVLIWWLERRKTVARVD